MTRLIQHAIRADASLALTGFTQVFLVAMNTVYIAKGNYPLAFLTSFGISYVWTRNVSRVALGKERDRWLYAGGAATGCLTGMALARFLLGVA
jgi:hypothetical protein